jgi:hypothetical protein
MRGRDVRGSRAANGIFFFLEEGVGNFTFGTTIVTCAGACLSHFPQFYFVLSLATGTGLPKDPITF